MPQVFIGPKSRLGLPEFAHLYANEGATPEEAASFIHTNYPTEAKSVMDRSWRALGINMAPEKYFATVANRQGAPTATPVGPAASPTARAVGPMMLSPTERPTFANEMERNIAIASGAYDPAFASPMQKASYEALNKMAADDRAAIRAAADKTAPVTLETPNDLLRSQLTGDTLGLAKKILIRRSGLSPEQYYGQKVGGDARDSMIGAILGDSVPELKPYSPPSGYGQLEGSALPNRLDRNIYDDPDFQKALAENPAEAAYAYYRLTGRQLAGDVGEQLASRKRQLDIGRTFAEQALKSGASRDAVTGKWSVWNMAEAEEGGLGLTPGRPSRQLVPATPEQQAWLDTHYEPITGRKMSVFDAGDKSYRNSVENVMRGDKTFADEVAADEATLKRKLTNEEMQTKAKRILDQNSVKDPISEGGKDFMNWLLNFATPPSDQDIWEAMKFLGNKVTPTTLGQPIIR